MAHSSSHKLMTGIGSVVTFRKYPDNRPDVDWSIFPIAQILWVCFISGTADGALSLSSTIYQSIMLNSIILLKIVNGLFKFFTAFGRLCS